MNFGKLLRRLFVGSAAWGALCSVQTARAADASLVQESAAVESSLASASEGQVPHSEQVDQGNLLSPMWGGGVVVFPGGRVRWGSGPGGSYRFRSGYGPGYGYRYVRRTGPGGTTVRWGRSYGPGYSYGWGRRW